MDRLVAVLDRPLSDPFGEEFLVAQNQGMARWVAQQIAARVQGATIAFVVCDRGDRYLSTGVFPI